MFKEVILICFLLINAVGILLNISDKKRAVKHKKRIKEKTLWLIGIFGGATGSYITMKTIRHKTKHKNFMFAMPILCIIQIFLLFIIISI